MHNGINPLEYCCTLASLAWRVSLHSPPVASGNLMFILILSSFLLLILDDKYSAIYLTSLVHVSCCVMAWHYGGIWSIDMVIPEVLLVFYFLIRKYNFSRRKQDNNFQIVLAIYGINAFLLGWRQTLITILAFQGGLDVLRKWTRIYV